MIKIAIVEDEDHYIKQLVEYLRKYEQMNGEELDIKIFRDGDGITADYKAQYDIILMDIQMKFVDGMTAAEEIRRMDSEVVIIFITNMTQYAIRGYEVDALDYVLKPVEYFAFSQKLNRAINRIKKRTSKFLTIQVKGGVMRIKLSDIYYVESQGHDLIYHTKAEALTVSGTMKTVEGELEAHGFSRANKCYLINLEHVDGVQEKCAVVHGTALQISRPRFHIFMQELTKYWGES